MKPLLILVIVFLIGNSLLIAQNSTDSGCTIYLAKYSNNYVVASSFINTNETKKDIGINNPITKLDIWGGNITSISTGFNGTANITSVNGIPYFSDNSHNKGKAVNTNGNIGIGTLSPIAMLEVNGTAKLSSDLLINGNINGKGGGNIITNVVFVNAAALENTTGTGNVFMGYQSGNLNTTGLGNTLNVLSAGSANNIVSNIVFLGYFAENLNISDYLNSILLQAAGYYNITGYSSSCSGNVTGFKNTTGSNTTFYGTNTGRGITIGTNGVNLHLSPGTQLSTTFFTNVNVGISTSTSTSYKLSINGPDIFTIAVVKLYGNWPEYFFTPTYQLPGLQNVAAYTAKKQQLNGFPTTPDIERNGIDLGNNQAVQQKKLKKLTLYLV